MSVVVNKVVKEKKTKPKGKKNANRTLQGNK